MNMMWKRSNSHLNRARKARDITEADPNGIKKQWIWFMVHILLKWMRNWAAAERERLGQIYISALEELAHLYLDANQLDQCLSICQLALAQNRLQ